MTKYIHIPEKKAYYKPQEGCCFWEVSYDPKRLGIVQRTDDEINELNSWDFFCQCHLGLEMIEVTEEEYNSISKKVCKDLEDLGLKYC